MKHRRFGATGLLVSEIGFGGSRIGGLLAQGTTGSGISTLHAALDAGINFFDTAGIYSQGEGEELIGQAFRGRRDRVIIASKGGYLLPTRHHLMARVKPLLRPVVRFLGLKREHLPGGIAGQLAHDFSASSLTNALEATLRRLRTDYVDIYQLHSPSSTDIASESFLETLSALQALQKAGKIRFFGVAADSLEDTNRAVQRGTFNSVQGPFGLLDPDANGLLQGWYDLRLGVIVRGCFGGGLLKDSLSVDELRHLTPKYDSIIALRRIAEERQRPMLELALQYCLRTPGIGVTLLGMRTEEHVRQNMRYYDAAPLTDDELAACNRLSATVPQPVPNS